MWKGWNDGGVPTVLIFVSLLVALIWGVATLVSIAFPNHPVSPALNATMGATVTALFGLVGTLAVRSHNRGYEQYNPPKDDPKKEVDDDVS